MDAVWPYVVAIVPTILVATLFYFLIKSMLEGDRRERLAQSALRGRGGPPAGRRGRPARGYGPREGGRKGPPSPPVDEPPNFPTKY